MAIERWSEEEVQILVENFDGTRGEIQEILEEKGYTRTIQAIKTKKRDLRAAGEMPAYGTSIVAPPVPPAGAEPEAEGVFPGAGKREIHANYKEMMQKMIGEATAEAKAKGTVIPSAAPVSSDAESIVLMLSDLHIGKVVENDGIEQFNTEIALQRIRELTHNVQRVIDHARKGTRIDEIVCLCLGDLVDNEAIYHSHAHHIDSHVALQVKNAIRALWQMIVTLSEIEGVEKVRVLCVRGNHGRSGAIGGHEDSNFDTIVHDGLEWSSILHGDPRISVSARYSQFNIAEVKGHRILMRHEAPAHADTAAAKARISGWLDLHSPIAAITYGHLHHPSISTYNDRYLFMNGSLVGGDDLSERMAVGNLPTQLLFGVTKKRIPSFIYPIALDN